VTADVRVVSWNVRFAGPKVAEAQSDYLRSLGARLLLLQEVNAASLDVYRRSAGVDWLTSSRSMPIDGFERSRRPGAAIGGRRIDLVRALPELGAAPLPERVHRAIVRIGTGEASVASYYAPPGVSFGYRKVENALAFLVWIQGVASAVVLGVDANSPRIDHPDFSLTKSWWHSGTPMMRGRPGDDALWGPNMKHHLKDALRVWLKAHPDQLASAAAARPEGPLAVSHWTGKRTLRPEAGTPRRYDAIWISDDFAVVNISYISEVMPALSDRAAVVADLDFQSD